MNMHSGMNTTHKYTQKRFKLGAKQEVIPADRIDISNKLFPTFN